jgi:hypothetical protein
VGTIFERKGIYDKMEVMVLGVAQKTIWEYKVAS